MLCGRSHQALVALGHAHAALARLDVGLNAPLALVIGVGVGLFGLIIEPDRARAPGELWRSLLLPDVVRRRRLAACLGSIAVSAPLWATAVAHFAKKAMAAEGSNAASGLAMAMAALRHGARHADVGPRGSETRGPRARAGARRSRSAPRRFSRVRRWPRRSWRSASSTGTTSGEGGWLGIWGVLKRPELDLRAPFLLGVVARRLATSCPT